MLNLVALIPTFLIIHYLSPFYLISKLKWQLIITHDSQVSQIKSNVSCQLCFLHKPAKKKSGASLGELDHNATSKVTSNYIIFEKRQASVQSTSIDNHNKTIWMDKQPLRQEEEY